MPPEIVVMSGCSPDEDILKVTSSEVKHWLAKPVAIDRQTQQNCNKEAEDAEISFLRAYRASVVQPNA